MIYIKRIINRKPIEERCEYPYNIPPILHMDEFEFRESVTFITGENGAGKSTFIEALAICAGFNPEGGSPNLNYHTYDSHSSLFNDLKLVRSAYRNKDGYFLRAESFYNVSSELDRISGRAFQMINYGGMLHEYSHGESFLALVQNRLSGNGLFIFDEPESALSISSQFRLLIRMKELVDNKSQFIIATHSPILLSYPGADIYRITNNGFESVTYEETDQFKLTKYFINNYPKMLDELGVSEDNNI